MNIKEYLVNNQPIVYQVLKNSFKNNKTSHAYIICGTKGSPILETAKFMAQSLICDNKDEDNLACLECVNCKKILSNGYADYKYYEGTDLKVGATQDIQVEFNKSAIEEKGIKIYIVNLIEKAPIESLNKMLKFIEEPTSNVVAIFTSNSVSSILPTIVSRCQVINLKEFKVKDIVNYLTSNGVASEDAWLISKVSNDAETNLAKVNQENYQTIKDCLRQSLSYLANSNDYFIVYNQVDVLKTITEAKDIELYLDMLEVCLLEAIIKQGENNYVSEFYDESISLIANKYSHIDKMIDDITNAKIDLLSNANNKNLVFDKLLINLLRRI